MQVANVNTLYPSNYIKAADLQGHVAKVIIKHIATEKIGNDEKPVLYFQGKAKGLVLNKTNGMTIAAVYGPETDAWEGGELELFPAFVDFQGRQVEAVRVRVPPRRPAPQPAPRTQPAQAAPPRTAAPARDDWQQPPPVEADPFEDSEIPF